MRIFANYIESSQYSINYGLRNLRGIYYEIKPLNIPLLFHWTHKGYNRL